MNSGFTGDFAKLVPRNELAKYLFSYCFAFVEKEDPFHLNFMVTGGNESPRGADEPTDDSTNYESIDSAGEAEPFQRECPNQGWFIISLNRNRLPEMPHLGWRFGRGSGKVPGTRGVEMMLSKPGVSSGKSLASNHFKLSVSPNSGFLLLQGGSSNNTKLELYLDGIWESIGQNTLRAIYQKSTILQAGKCEYELIYTLEGRHRDAFLQCRNDFIDEHFPKNKGVHLFFSRIPGDALRTSKQYLLYETKGSGGFGWVCQGLDTRTGEVVAIKRIGIKRTLEIAAIKEEVEIGRRFQNERGLLPIRETFCEHGYPDPCRAMEEFFIVFPFAFENFSTSFWRYNIPREKKLQLLEEPLQGLCTLHAAGIMHRDVTVGNILINSMSPPKASLCDFGKAVRAKVSSDTAIGPIYTCAPEVWTMGSRGPYTNSIDLWSFGYAVAMVIGCSATIPPGPVSNHKISHARHATIIRQLRDYATAVAEDEPLVNMTINLLAWSPADRLTATEALEHECWAPIRNQIVLTSPSSQPAKKVKLKDPETNSGNIGRDENCLRELVGSKSRKTFQSGQETEEFSEATKEFLRGFSKEMGGRQSEEG